MVGADGAQRAGEGSEGRLFAGRFEAVAVPNAGSVGHFARNTLQDGPSAKHESSRREGVGLEAGGEGGVLERSLAAGSQASGREVQQCEGQGSTHSRWYTGPTPSLEAVLQGKWQKRCRWRRVEVLCSGGTVTWMLARLETGNLGVARASERWAGVGVGRDVWAEGGKDRRMLGEASREGYCTVQRSRAEGEGWLRFELSSSQGPLQATVRSTPGLLG